MRKESCALFIHQIHNNIEKENNNKLRKKGITFSQMSVLMALVDIKEKGLTFKELEKKLALAQSTTAGLISRLEQKGLVEVFGDSSDKRIKYVRITKLGVSYCDDARMEINNTEEKLLLPLSEDEKKTLFLLLKKVNNSVK